MDLYRRKANSLIGSQSLEVPTQVKASCGIDAVHNLLVVRILRRTIPCRSVHVYPCDVIGPMLLVPFQSLERRMNQLYKMTQEDFRVLSRLPVSNYVEKFI